MDYSDFQALLRDKLKERGLSLKRLSELSGIALKHLEGLTSGNLQNLPAAPYLRGYLQRLARVLDFDPELWWGHLQKAAALISSGASDELPKNRFAPQKTAKYLWPTVIILAAIFYAALRFQTIFGRPTITVFYPNESIVVTNQEAVSISGKVEGSNELFVNSEVLRVAPDGSWQKSLILEPGLNTVEILAKKFLGREVKIIRQIIYEPPLGADEIKATSSVPASSSQ